MGQKVKSPHLSSLKAERFLAQARDGEVSHARTPRKIPRHLVVGFEGIDQPIPGGGFPPNPLQKGTSSWFVEFQVPIMPHSEQEDPTQREGFALVSSEPKASPSRFRVLEFPLKCHINNAQFFLHARATHRLPLELAFRSRRLPCHGSPTCRTKGAVGQAGEAGQQHP